MALPDLPDADLGYMVQLQNRLFEDRTLLGNLGYDTFGVPIILAVILAVLLFVCFIGFFLKDLAPYKAGIKAVVPFSR